MHILDEERPESGTKRTFAQFKRKNTCGLLEYEKCNGLVVRRHHDSDCMDADAKRHAYWNRVPEFSFHFHTSDTNDRSPYFGGTLTSCMLQNLKTPRSSQPCF